MTYRLIIAGTRDFDNYELLHQEAVKFLKGKYPSQVEIVSGHARGADTLGERFAKNTGCSLRLFPADWEKHQKAAGHIRNAEMAQYADGCLVFMCHGGSPGSLSMIRIARKQGLDLHVVAY